MLAAEDFTVPIPDFASEVTNYAGMLRLVRHYLTEPERWSKGSWAFDENGQSCASIYPGATCWCVAGAVGRASSDVSIVSPDVYSVVSRSVVYNRVVHAIYVAMRDREHRFGNIQQWNDHPRTTHSEVLRILDDAIAIADDHVAQRGSDA